MPILLALVLGAALQGGALHEVVAAGCGGCASDMLGEQRYDPSKPGGPPAPTAQAAPAAPSGSAPVWPPLGYDPKKPADALEHILDRTIVIINNTAIPLHFSVKLPTDPEWIQYPAQPSSTQGIFCPACQEDSSFRFYLNSVKGTINRDLKANYRYMIIAGRGGNWEILEGPALH